MSKHSPHKIAAWKQAHAEMERPLRVGQLEPPLDVYEQEAAAAFAAIRRERMSTASVFLLGRLIKAIYRVGFVHGRAVKAPR